jgi:hypothetical protein
MTTVIVHIFRTKIHIRGLKTTDRSISTFKIRLFVTCRCCWRRCGAESELGNGCWKKIGGGRVGSNDIEIDMLFASVMGNETVFG